MSEKRSINGLKIVMGIIVFGSLWGMLECTVGSVHLGGTMRHFPMGALLGGFFGLGIMAFSRRLYGVMWMQLGIALVAGLLRLWAPVGHCVICSALAIMAEGFVFELIFNRPALDISDRGIREPLGLKNLAFLGIVAGFVIYTVGYVFTQISTPLITTGVFNPSDFASVLPLIYGRGFFAALFGGVALPLAVSVKQLHVDLSAVRDRLYYPVTVGVSVLCWAFVLAFFHLP